MMRTLCLLVSGSILLSGCSSISFRQLDANLAAKPNTPNGAVYYLPKPYLLVTQLPYTAPSGGGATAGRDPAPPPGAKPASGYGKETGGTAATGGADDKPAASSGEAGALASGTDQSFSGISQGYAFKLIYLPDMSRPMALSVKPGFGTASMKFTLQNGWMLTGSDGSVDSKTTELLGAVPSLLASFGLPGSTAGGGDTSGGAAPGKAQSARPVLKPGLYAFNYSADGDLIGLCAVTFFEERGTVPASGDGACPVK